jgi:hypothetical protein
MTGVSVLYHVIGASRSGRVGHSDLQRPSTGSIWRPISRATREVGFCPLDRAVGVDFGFALRHGMRLEVRPFALHSTKRMCMKHRSGPS